jgi:hypothetical protein
MKIYILIVILFIVILAVPYNVQADNVYFSFVIPTMDDGTRVHYSPGWFGVMDYVPKDVTVLYFNDNDGIGYAYTSDTYMAPEAIVVPLAVVDNVLAIAEDAEGVYFGTKLDDRWLPEVNIETWECIIVDNGEIVLREGQEYGEIVYKQAVLCPCCGEFIMWGYEGIRDTREILTCNCGQRSVTKTYD